MRHARIRTFSLLLFLGVSCSQEKRTDREAAPAPAASQPAPAQAEEASAEGPPAAPAEAPQTPVRRTVARRAPKPARPAAVQAAPPARTIAETAPAQAATETAAAPAAGLELPAPAPAPVAPAVGPSAPPAPVYATVTAGTRIAVRFTRPLSTAESVTGDRFEAVIDSDVSAGNHVVFPKGTPVFGRVIQVERSGRVQGRASMSLTLTEVRPEKQSCIVKTETLNFEAESTTRKDAVKVGAGAAIGSVIGAIAGGGKGAAIGAAIGGGAGTGAVLATRGKEVEFSPEDRLTFTLNEELQIRIR